MPQSIESKQNCIYKQDNSQWVGILQGDFPSGSDGKESACNAEDQGSIPGLGRSPGEGNGNPLQYSFLENSLGRGAWQATVHGAVKSRIWPSNWAHKTKHTATQRLRKENSGMRKTWICVSALLFTFESNITDVLSRKWPLRAPPSDFVFYEEP